MFTQEEIERRQPLWQALSDLWLVDYEIDESETNIEILKTMLVISPESEHDVIRKSLAEGRNHIVKEMHDSKYGLVEIERILFEEVAPVVWPNLYKPYGGEWGGFEEEWLFHQIINNIKKQERNPVYRRWVRSGAGKFLMTKMVQKDWGKIAEIYKRELSIES